MAANASEHQVRRALVTALLRFMVEKRATAANSSGDAKEVKATVTANKMLLQRNIYDKQPGSDGPRPDQVDLLLLIQRDLASRAAKGGEGAKAAQGLMVQLVSELYIQDVLEQEGLEQWWEDQRASEGEFVKVMRSAMEKFMGALLAESESEEEDDEEEEEESEEESD